MMRSFLGLICAFSSIIVISGCSGVTAKEAIELNGQYWQRVNASSAIYTRGPKAQQILNRDIARCVVEMRELERLGEIHNAIPKYVDQGRVLSEAEANLEGIDSPERDEELLREHVDYHDFEGCMIAKGWERTKFVPFNIAEQSRKNYLKTHAKTKAEYEDLTGFETGDEELPEDDYKELNN